jgi:spore germination cell wall hydrolase CwlJ-like protein
LNSLEALTRIIWGEAESESFMGKCGVGAAIVNQSKAAGKSLLQVIQAPGQFEAYANRRFWRAPYNSRRPMAVEARRAAARVLSGADPVWGKTHFCAFQKDPCRWHYRQSPPVQIIGRHLFVRARSLRRRRR